MSFKKGTYKILRIKIWGKTILNFIQSSNKQDFYLFYPTITQSDHKISSHASFHSQTGRITFKTTSIIEGEKEILPAVLVMADGRPGFENAIRKSDLDLYKGDILTFDKPGYLYRWFGIALNMEKSDPGLFLKKGKSKDVEYGDVWNIDIPEEYKNKITLSASISKSDIPSRDVVFESGVSHRKYILYNHLGDEYAFVFNADYKFPKDVKNTTSTQVR